MTIGVGIIGLGKAGAQHLEAVPSVPGLEAVAAADPAPSITAETVAPARLYRDWRELLDDLRVQAVCIALPHHLHGEVTLAALEAGKHVLLEKPIGADLAEAQRIAEAARARPRQVLMLEMTHRFYPPIQEARRLVRSGDLGPIYAVEDRIIQPVVGALPAWMTQAKQAGGGVAMTNAVHMLDRIAWVCGQPLRYLTGVAGWTQRIGDIEDTASVQLALADGTPVALLACWPWRRGRIDDELTLYGTKATLRVWVWRGWRIERSVAEDEQGRIPPAEEHAFRFRDPRPGQPPTGIPAAMAEFAAAIREGRPANPSVDEVLPAQEILERFYEEVRPHAPRV